MNNTIGNRISSIRRSKGMTLVELSDKVGVSWQTIQKYEKSEITNISLDRIEKIAAVLNVKPAEIMGWDSSKTEEELTQEYVDNYNAKRLKAYQVTLNPDEKELLDLWRKAPLKIKMEVYKILTEGET